MSSGRRQVVLREHLLCEERFRKSRCQSTSPTPCLRLAKQRTSSIYSNLSSTPLFRLNSLCVPLADTVTSGRYLQNGNILAARVFITHLVSQFAASRVDFISSLQASPIPINMSQTGAADEIIFTTDSLANFAQLAVRTCQRSQGDKNKAMREAWVRLCGSYQSKGGLLAVKEVRQVSLSCEPIRLILFRCVHSEHHTCARLGQGTCSPVPGDAIVCSSTLCESLLGLFRLRSNARDMTSVCLLITFFRCLIGIE
jgi:hypothetical protein